MLSDLCQHHDIKMSKDGREERIWESTEHLLINKSICRKRET